MMFAPWRNRKLEIAATIPGRSGHWTRRMARGVVTGPGRVAKKRGRPRGASADSPVPLPWNL